MSTEDEKRKVSEITKFLQGPGISFCCWMFLRYLSPDMSWLNFILLWFILTGFAYYILTNPPSGGENFLASNIIIICLAIGVIYLNSWKTTKSPPKEAVNEKTTIAKVYQYITGEKEKEEEYIKKKRQEEKDRQLMERLKQEGIEAAIITREAEQQSIREDERIRIQERLKALRQLQ